MAYTTIDNPELHFQCKIYTGNAGTNALTLDGSEDMQPDMIWLKSRSYTDNHVIHDSVRGSTKRVFPNLNSGEGTESTSVTSFDSDGFTLGADGIANGGSGKTYVAWCWKESTTCGFDIVTYTGDASTDRSISHGLSVAPKTMWIKNRSGAHAWMVYHDVLGSNSGTTRRFLQLDNTNGQNNGGTGDFPAPPTSSVFKVGNFDTMNKSGDNIVAYLFHEVRGFSKYGLYVGNGSTDGALVHCGFRPAWLMTKEYKNGTGHWRIRDNKRSTFNPVGIVSHANASTGDTSEDDVDFLSNGFKIRTSGGENNGSGDVYAFWAFAEAPFVNSNGVPCNAR
tara:strand:- start:1989 stop:2996 length:1008 start_codon:yes stop_codon:yes gene_type:complete